MIDRGAPPPASAGENGPRIGPASLGPATAGPDGRGGRWWRPLAFAVGFLTVVPVPWVAASPRVVAVAAALFPVVGLALGVLLGAAGLALDAALPPGPVAALLLAANAALTGGLHLDGLMDTADGAFGGRTPERRLEIMRDSRVGAFGALAGALALLIQYACLDALAGGSRLAALVAAGGFGRWAIVVALARFAPVRPDGLAAAFAAGVGRRSVTAATAAALVLALAAGPLGLVGFAAAALVVLLGGRTLACRLGGGLTGDTYGALAVATETLVLVLAVALCPPEPA